MIDDVHEIVDELVIMLTLLDFSARGAYSLTESSQAPKLENAIKVIACDVRVAGGSGTKIFQRIANHRPTTIAGRSKMKTFV